MKKMKTYYKIILLNLLLIATCSNIVNSQTPGVTPVGYALGLNSDFSLGWRFSTSTPLVISSLGVFDEGANGLLSSHPVGLYSEAGVLLTTTTIPAGTGATLIGDFRYVSVPPIIIPVGTYRIAAVHTVAGGDVFAGFSGTQTYHPDITFLDSRFTSTSVLSFPIANNGAIGYYGGNFLAARSVVPTLDQWGLIILGLLQHFSLETKEV
jgi:hypothetical protein